MHNEIGDIVFSCACHDNRFLLFLHFIIFTNNENIKVVCQWYTDAPMPGKQEVVALKSCTY